ncbi:MAG TPA: hypothetical protein DEA55_01295 [Rhodospirillaceae bacterium]|nr:hypothetical protein [Rhodospirillaceae bacterium]
MKTLYWDQAIADRLFREVLEHFMERAQHHGSVFDAQMEEIKKLIADNNIIGAMEIKAEGVDASMFAIRHTDLEKIKKIKKDHPVHSQCVAMRYQTIVWEFEKVMNGDNFAQVTFNAVRRHVDSQKILAGETSEIMGDLSSIGQKQSVIVFTQLGEAVVKHQVLNGIMLSLKAYKKMAEKLLEDDGASLEEDEISISLGMPHMKCVGVDWAFDEMLSHVNMSLDQIRGENPGIESRTLAADIDYSPL